MRKHGIKFPERSYVREVEVGDHEYVYTTFARSNAEYEVIVVGMFGDKCLARFANSRDFPTEDLIELVGYKVKNQAFG